MLERPCLRANQGAGEVLGREAGCDHTSNGNQPLLQQAPQEIQLHPGGRVRRESGLAAPVPPVGFPSFYQAGRAPTARARPPALGTNARPHGLPRSESWKNIVGPGDEEAVSGDHRQL